MKLYRAWVRDKYSVSKVYIVIESEYNNKNDFIHDLRRNGYCVDPKFVKQIKEVL